MIMSHVHSHDDNQGGKIMTMKTMMMLMRMMMSGKCDD